MVKFDWVEVIGEGKLIVVVWIDEKIGDVILGIEEVAV